MWIAPDTGTDGGASTVHSKLSLHFTAPLAAWRRSTGLRARGGYEINCMWKGGKVTEVVVIGDKSLNQGNITIAMNGKDYKVKPTKPGHKTKPFSPS